MTAIEFKEMALSFPGTVEAPHFDKIAFKVVGKRIFTTLHKESDTANLKLSKKEQRVFCLFDKSIIYPFPNKWGSVHGWTTFELKKAPKELVLDALENAYKEVFRSSSSKKGKQK